MVRRMMPNSLAHQKDAELTPNVPTQFTSTISDSDDDLQASNPWSDSRCLKRRCAALTSAETAKGTSCCAPACLTANAISAGPGTAMRFKSLIWLLTATPWVASWMGRTDPSGLAIAPMEAILRRSPGNFWGTCAPASLPPETCSRAPLNSSPHFYSWPDRNRDLTHPASATSPFVRKPGARVV